MFFNSIRWRLQIWYGLILLAVLSGFGFTAYRLESGRQFRRIDDELHRRVNGLMNAVNLPPRGPGPGGPGFDRPERPEGPPESDDHQIGATVASRLNGGEARIVFLKGSKICDCRRASRCSSMTARTVIIT